MSVSLPVKAKPASAAVNWLILALKFASTPLLSADSNGVLANFSAKINQLTAADAGLALTGKLTDTDRNGTPDQLDLTAGSQTIKGTLQKSADAWKVYYNLDLSGRTAVDSNGNLTGR